MLKKTLTAETVRELLDYEPETGQLTWRVRRADNARAGSVAGCASGIGYGVLSVENRKYYAHRLAWLHYYGEWPTHHIDHIDGNKSNNAIANLRDVTRSTNLQNLRKARSDSAVGLLGVSPHTACDGFYARIRVDGKVVYLGSYRTAELAHEAYIDAKRKMHKGCAI